VSLSDTTGSMPSGLVGQRREGVPETLADIERSPGLVIELHRASSARKPGPSAIMSSVSMANLMPNRLYCLRQSTPVPSISMISFDILCLFR
jgi:hypothetical protein